MKILFGSRRLYSCAECGGRFLLPSTRSAGTGTADTADEKKKGRRRKTGSLVLLLAPMLVIAGAAVWRFEAEPDRVTRATTVSSAPATGSCQREHIYKAGETFDEIATEELGAAWRWQEIAVLNRKALDDAFGKDGLMPGTVLLIPVRCAH